MGKTLQAIEREIARLSAERDRIRATEVKQVIARIKDAIKHYSLTAADLGLTSAVLKRATKVSSLKGKKLPVKYADGTGNQWSGVGRRPRWYLDALASGKSDADLRSKA